MYKFTIILFLLFFLIDCNYKKQGEDSAEYKDSTVSLEDSLLKVKTDDFFNNSYRDRSNFDVKFGDHFIDSLIADYLTQEQAEIKLVKDICNGDYCHSYKIITSKKSNTVLYLFKSDYGDYGFGNDQFIVQNDSLIYNRNFSVTIESLETDNTPTKWRIEELVYSFQEDKPKQKKREISSEELYHFDYTLQNVKTEIIEIDTGDIYDKRKEELKHLLELEKD